MKVDININSNNILFVDFNSLPQLTVDLNQTDAIQSWIQERHLFGIRIFLFRLTNRYCIEYTLKSGAHVLTEYSDKFVWIKILMKLPTKS
jgi:hypothetical protein